MPLPSSINDLSQTAASNSPAGSESPSLLDDYLRVYAAYIATLRDTQVSLTGDQTIAGNKTFSSPILGSTNTQVSLTGDQTIAGTKTFNLAPVVPGLNGGQIGGQHNGLINGNFDVWQRGTSFINPTSVYTADRWLASGTASTVSRATGVAGYGNFAFAITATAATNSLLANQAMESSTVQQYKGRRVTFSIAYNASTAQPTNSLSISVQKNATADTATGGTWVTLATVSGASNYTPTTATQIATITVDVPNDGTANGLRVNAQTTNINNGTTVNLFVCQIETGSVATPFEYLQYPTVLQMCRRFGRPLGTGLITGQAFTATSGAVSLYLDTLMRATPTLSTTAGFSVTVAGGGTAGATPAINSMSDQLLRIDFSGTTGLVAGNATFLIPPAAAFLSAELS